MTISESNVTYSSRYEVRSIGDNGGGPKEKLTILLWATNDASEAKAKAVEFAWSCYYGTAIVDRQERTVDFGDKVIESS